jgi:hypothetical protein
VKAEIAQHGTGWVIRRFAGEIRLDQSPAIGQTRSVTVYVFWNGGDWRSSLRKAMKFSESSTAKDYLLANESRMNQEIKCALVAKNVPRLIRNGAIELG